MALFPLALLASLLGCEPQPRCSPADVLSGHTCAGEHDDCGGIDGPVCAEGLECVSELLCTIGPCPGECREPCEDDQDCDDGDRCEGEPDAASCVTPG